MSRTGLVAVLSALFFIRGLALICFLPPLEMWDEYSHLGCIDFWAANGRAPIYGHDVVAPELMSELLRLPLPQAAGFGMHYKEFWNRETTWQPRQIVRGLYEAQHPFLYYCLGSYPYRLAGGRHHLLRAVATLRLLNLAAGTLAILVILSWMSRSLPRSHLVLIGGIIVLHPLLLLDIVRIANDSFAFLLGTAVVATGLRYIAAPSLRSAVMMSALLPIAVLCKATNVALYPFVIVVVLASNVGTGMSILQRAGRCCLIFAVSLPALYPYITHNLKLYGIVMPMQEAMANKDAGRSMLSILAAFPPGLWPRLFASWWVTSALWVGGWSFLWPPRFLVIIYLTIVVTATCSLILNWRRSCVPARAKWAIASLFLSINLGMMYHAVQSYSAWHGLVYTNSWYGSVAVPWLVVLFGSTLFAFRRISVGFIVLSATLILYIAAETYGLFMQMIPHYYGSACSINVLKSRIDMLHPTGVGFDVWVVSECATALLIAVLAWQIIRLAQLPRQPIEP